MRALIAAAALLAASPALAQEDGPDGARVSDQALAGFWTFDSEPFFAFGVTQNISGEVELRLQPDGTYRCDMSVTDLIPEDDVTIRTEQTCIAVRDGEGLEIYSTVISVDPPDYNYVPDNFTLTIVSDRRMEGVMHAAGDDPVPAVFTRGGALLS
jgi:hypothetical protein